MAYPALTSTQDFATLSASHSENSGPESITSSHCCQTSLYDTKTRVLPSQEVSSQARSEGQWFPKLSLSSAGSMAGKTVTCFPSHGKAHFAHLRKGLTNSPSLNNHLACQPFFQVKLTFHEEKQLADTAVPGMTSCFGLRQENPPGPPPAHHREYL